MRLDTKEKRLQYRQMTLKRLSCEVKEFPEVSAVVGYYQAGEKLAAIAFSGTAGRPNWRYTFRSEESRNEYVQKWIDGLKRRQEYKAERKAKKTGLAEPAHSAKILKGHLQKFFPDVKFSVTSDTFSMGCSINVSYTDGPLLEEVEAIASLFEYGRFDGMQDLAYSVDVHVPGCRGAKYVSVNREMSNELSAALLPILKKNFAPKWDKGDEVHNYAPYQIAEAEMLFLGITAEDVKQRNEKRVAVVLGENYAREDAPESTKTAPQVVTHTKKAGNVVSLADFKQQKEQQEKQQRKKKAVEDAEFITHLISTMTTPQIESIVRRMYADENMDNKPKLVAIKHFLFILAERDKSAALKLFRELDLASLAR